MNINSDVLLDVINKGQTNHVVKVLEEAKKSFNVYAYNRTFKEIFEEAKYVSGCEYSTDKISYEVTDALEELEMHYTLENSNVRDLVPISCYLANDNYGTTRMKYYLLGIEVIGSMIFDPEVKYYLFIVDNNYIRRIETTDTFITTNLIKDYNYQPRSLGDIIDELETNHYWGNDVG